MVGDPVADPNAPITTSGAPNNVGAGVAIGAMIVYALLGLAWSGFAIYGIYKFATRK